MRYFFVLALIAVAESVSAQSITYPDAPFSSLGSGGLGYSPAFFSVGSRDLNEIRDFRIKVRGFLTEIGFKKEEPRDRYWNGEGELFVGRYGDSEAFRIYVSDRLQIYTYAEGVIVWNTDTNASNSDVREAITQQLSRRIHALREPK